MELALLTQHGLPEGCIISVRAGTVRRQAAAASGRPFRFPKIGMEENPVKIDILKPVATAYLVVKPGETQYKVSFGAGAVSEMDCEVEIKKAEGGTGDAAHGEEANKPGAGSANEAKDYLEAHQILQFIQALLQTVIKERPDQPYIYMARHFMSGYNPTDTRFTGTKPTSSSKKEPESELPAETPKDEAEPLPVPAEHPATEIPAAQAAPEQEIAKAAASTEEVAPPPADKPKDEVAPEEEAVKVAAPTEEAAPPTVDKPKDEAAPEKESVKAAAATEEAAPPTADKPKDEAAPEEEAVKAAAPTEEAAPPTADKPKDEPAASAEEAAKVEEAAPPTVEKPKEQVEPAEKAVKESAPIEAVPPIAEKTKEEEPTPAEAAPPPAADKPPRVESEPTEVAKETPPVEAPVSAEATSIKQEGLKNNWLGRLEKQSNLFPRNDSDI